MNLNLFYKESQESEYLESVIKNRIDVFVAEIKRDDILSKYISSFGILWPCARWQWFWFDKNTRSDVDFFVITKSINPIKDKYLKKKFNMIFPKDLDCSLFTWNEKRSYKRPDLMFFEYVTNGLFLHGTPPKQIDFSKISKFEVFRNIVYRSHFFLRLFDIKNGKKVLKYDNERDFLYAYSKIIFLIEEVLLILDGTYVADNFQRKELLKSTEFIHVFWEDFLDEHSEIFNFRYENIIPSDYNNEQYIKRAFILLEKLYCLVFEKLFDGKKERLKKIHPEFISFVSTRIFFTIRYWKFFKKIRCNIFSESFVLLTLKYYWLIQDINTDERIEIERFNEILELCNVAPRFYYKI